MRTSGISDSKGHPEVTTQYSMSDYGSCTPAATVQMMNSKDIIPFNVGKLWVSATQLWVRNDTDANNCCT